MALRQDRSRTRLRSTRRRSPCYRHPKESITGICAACLRDRLHGLDFTAAASLPSAELRRCRSYASASKYRRSSVDLQDPCRTSCDALSNRSSMSALFDAEDSRSGSESELTVDSNNADVAKRIRYGAIESKEEDRTLDSFYGVEDSNGEEFKTVKEFIDLEFQNRTRKSSSDSKHLKAMAANLFGAASVVGKKFLKWRQKSSETKKPENAGQDHFPISGGKSSSPEPARSSFEHRRASWDGYMIARTIPRLAPMFSVVENDIIGKGNQFHHALSVDDVVYRSGASGSGNSNSDSSSSMRQSSFDRSSSVRSSGKRHEYSTASPNVKLVITEKELQDWHLNAGRNHSLEKMKPSSISTKHAAATDGACFSDTTPVKKSVKWHKLRNALGFRPKNSETVSSNGIINDDHSTRNQARRSIDVGSMYSSEFIHRRKSVDTASLKYYSPLNPSRNGVNGNKHKSHCIAASTLHLN